MSTLRWQVRRVPEGWRGLVSLAASEDGRARVTCAANGATALGALEQAAVMASRIGADVAVREDSADAASDLEAVCGFIPPAQAAAAASKALDAVKSLFRAIRRRRRKRREAARARAEQASPATPRGAFDDGDEAAEADE